MEGFEDGPYCSLGINAEPGDLFTVLRDFWFANKGTIARLRRIEPQRNYATFDIVGHPGQWQIEWKDLWWKDKELPRVTNLIDRIIKQKR